MKKWLFATLLGSALVLGACGGGNDDGNNNNGNNNNNQEENNGEVDNNNNEANNNENGNNNETTDTAAAEELFKNNCASCHGDDLDRKSTRLNSSHVAISYAVFCLKKKKITNK